MTALHQPNDIITIFNQCFEQSYQTVLELGGDEPIYLPADNNHRFHRIIFAHGYYASALHEIAHWMIAGEKRRLLEDYGYWYQPDGRSDEVQAEFEKVEIKPQAIEWIIAMSCGYPFRVSCDNLNGQSQPDRMVFTKKVQQQVFSYLEKGVSTRVEVLSNALRAYYQVDEINPEMFQLPKW
ncbi:elongation factor P hydroxylase [Vibrio sp. SS-MA-C1-2]|uniref:elongation factor P hydroxylase n=1 Tax=Vibrio sp. SS-MA-C1-2 TaxID=2908646 RepID=UPI001F28B7E4|nr:elongation factor P hydroxylase [Vibrio sp. SS-MA-C1-2]UJF17536.1 elongation factor P hydroxylase [Vibrio sp. SS-MA-C1-2]